MEEFKVELFPEFVTAELFGHTVRISPTVLTTWGIIAVIFILALLFRLIAVPRMKDKPRGLQLVMELIIDKLDGYIGSKLPKTSLGFGAYIFSLSIFLVSCAFVELFGLRAPTADITMTFALALITFFLVNYYGFKAHEFLGRLKAFRNPFHILSDVVAPVSLACRLFGNMFGGMIIIELLYAAMGHAAIALPSVAGLYFNVFHPLIQAFIFITLTLSYIQEATGLEGESS